MGYWLVGVCGHCCIQSSEALRPKYLGFAERSTSSLRGEEDDKAAEHIRISIYFDPI